MFSLLCISHLYCSSYSWGIAADYKGRKPVIITSLLLLGVSTAFFGFSVHFAMAIIARFLVGITNGKSLLATDIKYGALCNGAVCGRKLFPSLSGNSEQDVIVRTQDRCLDTLQLIVDASNHLQSHLMDAYRVAVSVYLLD